MTVRAKFTVQYIQERQFREHTYSEVVMAPQYDPDLPEDQRFTKATPSGELRMTVDNPPALEQFKPGRVFYLDFVPVEEQEA